jgi:hypothetical protein
MQKSLKVPYMKDSKEVKISGCVPVVPHLAVEDTKASPRIIAQMGPEPLLQIIASCPEYDILIAGRAYNPAPYVAFCTYQAMKLSSTGFKSLGSTLCAKDAEMASNLSRRVHGGWYGWSAAAPAVDGGEAERFLD